MSSNSKAKEKSFRKIKSILISQPKPERSPYYELEERYGLQIDWRQFIQVEPVTEKEFRKTRIRPDEYTAIIFTAKGAVDHFFRMCEEMRIKMPQDTKYFCLSEAIANYLQKFIVYRKRKVFAGKRLIQDLKPSFMKHKDNEKFLLPCSNLGAKPVVDFLEKNEIEFQDAMMYRTVSADLSDLEDVTYDVLVFFSPLGIDSLYENFPEFKQKGTRMAIYGNATQKAVSEKGLTIDIPAPAPDTPSMTMALKKYLELSNK
jgi:uroporphyrinogen-III synthase